MRARSFPVQDSQAGVFHVVSRVVGRQPLLGAEEKDFFVEAMRGYEEMLGLDAMTWCVMDNHFHILVRVPHVPEEDEPDLDTLLDRMKRSVGPEQFQMTMVQLNAWQRDGNEAAIGNWRQTQIRRMYSLSEFMRCLKLRLTRSFNRKSGRRGVLWESRYSSVIVEEEERALRTLATYIDLNPVRAGVVEDPADYGWSGYAEAVRGDVQSQIGIVRIVGRAAWEAPDDEDGDVDPARGDVPLKVRRRALLIYRSLLGFGGRERKADGETTIPALSEEEEAQLIDEAERAQAAELAARRVRQFTAGVIVGGRQFIDNWFENHRNICRGRSATERKTGARSMGRPELRGLYSLRTLRDD